MNCYQNVYTSFSLLILEAYTHFLCKVTGTGSIIYEARTNSSNTRSNSLDYKMFHNFCMVKVNGKGVSYLTKNNRWKVWFAKEIRQIIRRTNAIKINQQVRWSKIAIFSIDILIIISCNSEIINYSIDGNNLQHVIIERNPMIVVIMKHRRKKAGQTSSVYVSLAFFIIDYILVDFLLSFYYHKRLSGHSPGNRFSILFVILFRPYIYFQTTEKPVEPKFYGYLTFEHNVILR